MLRHYYTEDHQNQRWNQRHRSENRYQNTLVDERNVNSICYDDIDPRYYQCERRSNGDMICDASTTRRYSLSNGSVFFPSMSLQELDKIDTTEHQMVSRNYLTAQDAKHFDDERTIDRVSLFKTSLNDKYINIDDSIRYFNKHKQSKWDTSDEFLIEKSQRRDSLFSISCSRRNSLCSLNGSIHEGGDNSSVLLTPLRLDRTIREGEWNTPIAIGDQISPQEENSYPAYGYETYEPESQSELQQQDEYVVPASAPAPVSIVYDPEYLTVMMESLANSMAETFKSQQSIHDWDKKMGLKRSHSKTMRMSMRTRKKLRALIKKELGN
jgi:hypothetical protein